VLPFLRVWKASLVLLASAYDDRGAGEINSIVRGLTMGSVKG
jgi:hypothetical protein